ncbi:hypothetical protein HYC85_008345 [Camellia sinensis]|uniref:CHASE domain-containing protein n=1 Tax=Camellia sinensis TaxID=4442 RepID=A0A7J7HSA7_CAMSI|nr:hypothetical protein HYC85_008345 [Camellia sinensis]
MVKKQSKLLGKTSVDEDDASDVEMEHFWHDFMDLYFIRGRESRGCQDNDLVFFVRKMFTFTQFVNLCTNRKIVQNVLRARESRKRVLTAPFRLLKSNRMGVILSFAVYKTDLPSNATSSERIQATDGRFKQKPPGPWFAMMISIGILVIALLLGHIINAIVNQIANVEDDYHEMMELKKRAEAADVAKSQSLHGYSSNNMEVNSPYFVRRWAPKLDDLVDKNSVYVDWRRSFYLNLIAHTLFSVTVAICSYQVLKNHQTSLDTPLSSIYKEVESTPAYPDICFAVDDFDSTFDAVVLTDTDHCYCVILNADGGAAFPSEKTAQDCSSSDISSLKINTGSGKTEKTKLTLFLGFVSYQMVRDAYEAGKSRFESLLSLGHSPGKTDRIHMKGPGGRGEVEVVVSRVVDRSKQVSGPSSPELKRGFSIGIGTILRRAASVASVAAKHAYAAAASTQGSNEEMLPLKCCLMSVSLPWEHIAYDLLFKVG